MSQHIVNSLHLLNFNQVCILILFIPIAIDRL